MEINEKLEGCTVTFNYHEKPRKGKVEKVGTTHITVQLENDDDGKEYKSFTKSKISNLKKAQTRKK